MLFGRQGQEGISGFTRKVVASGEDARVCYFILFYFFTVSFVFLFWPNYFFPPKSEMFPNISGMSWYFPVYRVALNDCVYFSLFIYFWGFWSTNSKRSRETINPWELVTVLGTVWLDCGSNSFMLFWWYRPVLRVKRTVFMKGSWLIELNRTDLKTMQKCSNQINNDCDMVFLPRKTQTFSPI